MDTPRIAVWRAVSTDDQAGPDRDSLDHQMRLNLEHVARWKGVIVARLEVTESRNIILWEEARERIEAFAELDDLIRHKKIDILMCYDLTRIARTAALAATVCALCERAGIRIYETTAPPYSLDGPISTPESRIVMLFKIHQTGEETRKFSERAHFGRQAQARKGKHANRPPLGLKSVKRVIGDDVETFTVIDEEWRPIVEQFFDLYVTHGRSQFAIVKEFNARGLTTPEGHPWDVKTIRLFLKNRWAYAGYVVWGTYSNTPEKSFRVKAEWPAMISEEMVYGAERGMKERTGAPKAAGRPWRFSMMMKCIKCGCTMHTCMRKENSRALSDSYICRRRCEKSYIRGAVIEVALTEAIQFIQNAAQLELLAGETPPQHASLTELLAESQKALEANARKRKRLSEEYFAETIDQDEYRSLMADLKTEQINISSNITSLQEQISSTPTAEQRRQRLEEIRDRGLEMLKHPDEITANAWLRQHFRIYIENHKVVTVELY